MSTSEPIPLNTIAVEFSRVSSPLPDNDQPNFPEPLIDVRPEAEFVIAHVPGSANIPLEQLSSRSHELPLASDAMCVTDPDDSRANQAAQALRRRGHRVTVHQWDARAATERGLPSVHLWKPSPFLVESLDHVTAAGAAPGRALDVACGSGRDAVYLALCGYEVEAIDLLPDALDRAADLARRSGVAIRTRIQDLEADPELPQHQYDLVTVFRYLQRSLFPSLRETVRSGGHIIYETFHERNRSAGHKPCSPDHLLRAGELRQVFDGFDVLICREAFERDGRFFSSVLARRPI